MLLIVELSLVASAAFDAFMAAVSAPEPAQMGT